MRIDLLIADPAPDPAAASYFGGPPILPAGLALAWPLCRVCAGPMQHLGRVPHPLDPGKRVLLFMCANQPGLCGEWEADSGANRALIVSSRQPSAPLSPPGRDRPAGLRGLFRRPARTPDNAVTTLATTWSGHVLSVDGQSYGHQREARRRAQAPGEAILGQLGGQPDWLQDDETPDCPACGRPMVLAAQLEEGPDPRAAANFGGGCAYAFVCACPGDQALFLWQA
jgi:hypothetical protein